MLQGGVLATDEVMRRVETGVPFRRAYRDVAAALKRGDPMPPISPARIIGRRRSTGGLGRLGLGLAWRRFVGLAKINDHAARTFEAAIKKLGGRAS